MPQLWAAAKKVWKKTGWPVPAVVVAGGAFHTHPCEQRSGVAFGTVSCSYLGLRRVPARCKRTVAIGYASRTASERGGRSRCLSVRTTRILSSTGTVAKILTHALLGSGARACPNAVARGNVQ